MQHLKHLREQLQRVEQAITALEEQRRYIVAEIVHGLRARHHDPALFLVPQPVVASHQDETGPEGDRKD